MLTYGVKYIQGNPVQEVRVVGHTDCGGVKACHDEVKGHSRIPPELREWLRPLLELAHQHAGRSALELTEENVRTQVWNVRKVLNDLGFESVGVKGFVYHVEERELREVPVLTPINAA